MTREDVKKAKELLGELDNLENIIEEVIDVRDRIGVETEAQISPAGSLGRVYQVSSVTAVSWLNEEKAELEIKFRKLEEEFKNL